MDQTSLSIGSTKIEAHVLSLVVVAQRQRATISFIDPNAAIRLIVL